MSFPWNITNPGFNLEGLLTSTESSFVTNLVGLTPNNGDTFVFNSVTNLWETGPGGSSYSNIYLDNTTFTNQNGIIYKNTTPFIHDFNYGNNGTVTTIGNNTFIGINSGNLTMGSTALAVYQASYNTVIGKWTLNSNTTGYRNTAIGYNTLLSNTTGHNNTAHGVETLRYNTSGFANTAIGPNSLYLNTSGINNTAIGYQSLFSNSTGNDNTAIGYLAGGEINSATGTGANTIIGNSTGRGIVTGVNNTIIGANVTGLSAGLSNNIIIADGAGNRRINVGSTGNVGIGTTSPDTRLVVGLDTAGQSNYITIGKGWNTSSGLLWRRGGVIDTRIETNETEDLVFSINEQNLASTIDFIFKGNNTEILRISNTGNVGIGTTNPQTKLALASGSAISFETSAGVTDIAITHSADTLTFAGGTIVLGTATATGGLTGNVTGTASLATSLTGGSGGSIPYQSSAGVTAMLANGTAGQVLQSNGTTLAPSWVAAGAGDMVLASVQTVTGLKTFDTTKIAVKGSSTGSTAIASANTSATDYTLTLPAVTGTLVTGGGTASGTNTGDQTSIVGITGTKAQFNTAVTDGDIMYVGDAPTSHTHLLAVGATDVTASASEVNILDGATLTVTELNYVDGVTSAIQTQLDTKVSATSTNTLTNKRITPRTGTTTSSATPTINTDNVDFYSLTAQAVDITSMTTNLSGTPTEAQKLWIAITGTAARAITWGASFENGSVALPTTTVTTTRLDVGFIWNSVTSKWRCVASGSTA